VELENEIMSHPDVAEAAVVGIVHPKWGEAALACVVRTDDSLTEEAVIAHLEGKIAKWQMPKGVVWIDEVPKTSVGKFSKKTLRDDHADLFMNQ
jgi:fatty-acyl-CoA synthase